MSWFAGKIYLKTRFSVATALVLFVLMVLRRSRAGEGGEGDRQGDDCRERVDSHYMIPSRRIGVGVDDCASAFSGVVRTMVSGAYSEFATPLEARGRTRPGS